MPEKDKSNPTLVEALKKLDVNANVNWPLMHMGSAYRYLAKENKAVDATGGTNWRDYLPPSFQRIIFFPNLYSENELDSWGKQWVDHMFNPAKKEKE